MELPFTNITNTLNHRRERQCSFLSLLSIIFLLFIIFTCLGSGMTVHGTGVVPLDFEITLEGQVIPNASDHYSGAVTVILQLQDTSDTATLWINQKNVWMLINHQKEDPHGQYRLPFAKDGYYNLTFKTENPDTLEKITKDVSFTIATQMGIAIQSVNALPDPQNTNNNAVTAAKDDVRISMNLVNGLPSKQRVLLPGVLTGKLDGLRSWLENMKTGFDYTPPDEPSVELTSSGIFTQNCYSSAVTATISPNLKESALVLVDQGDGWKQLEKNSAGQFSITFTEPRSYNIRFCTADSSGNRSTCIVKEFSIDPDVPLILSEIQRIRTNLADLPLNDYITDLEKVYLQYLNLSPNQQALVPNETQEELVSMYQYIMTYVTFSYEDHDEDGRYIQGIGLYQSLNVGMKWLQRVDVALNAERLKPPASLPGIQGTPLSTYKISITPSEIESVPLVMNAQAPVKICIQLPEDLKGRKNVDMFLVEGNTAKPMGAKVRSTKDNLVLYFDITKPGNYVLVSQTNDTNPSLKPD